MNVKNSRKVIIFGAGQKGRQILDIYGHERVACFADNNRAGEQIEGLKVISMTELVKIWKSYRVIVAVGYCNTALEIGELLRGYGIQFEFSFVLSNCMHVYYMDKEWHYDIDELACYWSRDRLTKGTVPMLKDTLDRFGDGFINRDFYVYGGDYATEADECRRLLGIDRIFAYSTLWVLKDKVYAVPDYKFYLSGFFGTEEVEDCDASFEGLRKSGMKPWKKDMAFWGGNLMNSQARYSLNVLAEEHPDKIFIAKYYNSGTGYESGRENLIRISEFSNYKYLIDIRGFGWTDRVKLLLAMGRPLLMVERPFIEYYFDRLVPMTHYVPIKEDLSDLIDKIDYLDMNPDTYNYIVQNALKFTIENFKKEMVLEDMCRIINQPVEQADSGES